MDINSNLVKYFDSDEMHEEAVLWLDSIEDKLGEEARIKLEDGMIEFCETRHNNLWNALKEVMK